MSRRPFHEAIVDEIGNAEDLYQLGRLIVATKIPKNHDAIIAAWKERIEELEEDHFIESTVLVDLEEQKREAEERERLETVDLEEQKREAEERERLETEEIMR